MNGFYDSGLVALSVAIATLASYTALDLAGRVSANAGNSRRAWAWLLAGALSLGSGIWAMHFVGMLAFHLPIPIAYDLPITWLSMAIAVGVSAVALFILKRPEPRARDILIGAALMGAGISAMHYTGMMAMRMLPAIDYDPVLFVLSILIAVGASLAALLIAFQLRKKLERSAVIAKLGSAAIMGAAIAGMHYTGMAAAHFAPGSICIAAAAGGLQNTTIAIVIGGIAMAIMCATLILSTFDAHFAAKNARLAESLRVAKDSADEALRVNETITAQLRAAQSDLVAAARQAGMAEIASNVLHNVGNVLNSVNVSADLIGARLRDSKTPRLADTVRLLDEHRGDLARFLTQDEKGSRVLGYLGKLVDALRAERDGMSAELESMHKSIEHIKDIVATQQSYAGSASLLEPVQISTLLDDAVRMSMGTAALQRMQIRKEIVDLPPLMLDKHLILQILINLISNARQAIDAAQNPAAAEIVLRASTTTATGETLLRITVEDNGDGIAPPNLPRLFEHGFTTRTNGHGFGLHSSALAAHALGGSLAAHSDGPGHGAVFTLELPIDAQEHTAAEAA